MTWEYSLNNHVYDKGNGPTWISGIGQCKRKPDSFKQECINAAQMIYDRSDKSVYVFASGGRDSLFALNCFKEAGINFKALIMSWEELNYHDNMHAIALCEDLNIDTEIISFDIIPYIESGNLYHQAKDLKSWAHQIPPIVEIIKNLDGIPVLCNGDPFFVNFSEQRFWYDLEVLHVFRKWMTNNMIKGIPEFYKYTPEQLLSFSQELNVNGNSREIKYELYNKYYNFTVNEKYDGWEQIKKLYPDLTHNLLNQMKKIKLKHNGVYLIEKGTMEDYLHVGYSPYLNT